MKPRRNCPECHLRDVTHVVVQPDAAPVLACKQCAWSYDYPARITPIDE